MSTRCTLQFHDSGRINVLKDALITLEFDDCSHSSQRLNAEQNGLLWDLMNVDLHLTMLLCQRNVQLGGAQTRGSTVVSESEAWGLIELQVNFRGDALPLVNLSDLFHCINRAN